MPLSDAILIENGALTRVNRIVRAIERLPDLANKYKAEGLTPQLVKVAEAAALARRESIFGSARDSDGRFLGRVKGQSPFATPGVGKRLEDRRHRGTSKTSKKGSAYTKPFVTLSRAAKQAIANFLGIGAAYARGVVAKREQLYGTTKGLKFGSVALKGAQRAKGSYILRGAGKDAKYREQKAALRKQFPGKVKPAAYYEKLVALRASHIPTEKLDAAALVGKDGSRYGTRDMKSARAKASGAGKAATSRYFSQKSMREMEQVMNNPFGYDDLAIVSNPSGIGFLDSAESMIAGVPVVGEYIAPIVTPAVLGAAAFGVHYFAVPYVEKYLPSAAKPFAYTIGGSAVGIVSGVVAAKAQDSSIRNAAALIGGAAVAIGVGLDLFRKYGGGKAGDADFGALALDNPGVFGADEFGAVALENSGMFGAVALENPGMFGDGMAYQLGPVGGLGYDADTGAIALGYAGSSMADAYYSGADFDGAEGEAILGGAAEFRRAAGAVPVSAAGQRSHASNLAGRRFHRWGWLVKMIGFDNVQKLAALSPEERLRIIQAMRSQALQAYQRGMAAHAAHEPRALSAGVAAFGPTAPGAAPGVGDALGYGALAVADY
jgi:hypothetical protein